MYVVSIQHDIGKHVRILSPQPEHLDAVLRHYIQEICNCTNFTVNVSLLNCIDSNMALYTIKLFGPVHMVDNILEQWANSETYNSQGFDVGVVTISLCNNTCLTYVYNHGMSQTSYTTAGYWTVIITTFYVILGT